MGRRKRGETSCCRLTDSGSSPLPSFHRAESLTRPLHILLRPLLNLSVTNRSRSNPLDHRRNEIIKDRLGDGRVGLMYDIPSHVSHLIEIMLEIRSAVVLCRLVEGCHCRRLRNQDSDEAEHAMLVIGVPASFWVLIDIWASAAIGVC